MHRTRVLLGAAAGVLLALCAWGAAGCSRPPQTPRPPDKPGPTSAPDTGKMSLQCEAFAAGKPVPRRHTGDGEDVSPRLTWSGLPEGTKELALIVDDPDAPSPQPWVHWVIYKIPADAAHLPEGLAATPTLASPPGAVQGRNSWGEIGWRGPSPPQRHGVHHYHFRLYALDAPLEAKPGLDKKALLAATSGHVLAEAEIVGTYERK